MINVTHCDLAVAGFKPYNLFGKTSFKFQVLTTIFRKQKKNVSPRTATVENARCLTSLCDLLFCHCYPKMNGNKQMFRYLFSDEWGLYLMLIAWR